MSVQRPNVHPVHQELMHQQSTVRLVHRAWTESSRIVLVNRLVPTVLCPAASIRIQLQEKLHALFVQLECYPIPIVQDAVLEIVQKGTHSSQGQARAPLAELDRHHQAVTLYAIHVALALLAAQRDLRRAQIVLAATMKEILDPLRVLGFVLVGTTQLKEQQVKTIAGSVKQASIRRKGLAKQTAGNVLITTTATLAPNRVRNALLARSGIARSGDRQLGL